MRLVLIHAIIEVFLFLVPCFCKGTDMSLLIRKLNKFSASTKYALNQILEAQKELQDSLDYQQQLRDLKTVVESQAKEIGSLKASLKNISSETKSAGAVYTRWGRYECPQNDTELVYKGFTGSSYETHTGGSVNYICLPYDPLWGKYNDVMKNDNQNLHGVEYAGNSINISGTPFDSKLRGHGVPCAVCRSTKRSSVLRIPGRNKCYKDWHLEYAGYLMADKFTHASATEYACVDEQPEKSKTGPVSKGGQYFYPVEAHCGHSLQCPPYVHGREITCAICTK